MWKPRVILIVLAAGAAAVEVSGHDGAGSFLLAVILIELFG